MAKQEYKQGDCVEILVTDTWRRGTIVSRRADGNYEVAVLGYNRGAGPCGTYLGISDSTPPMLRALWRSDSAPAAKPSNPKDALGIRKVPASVVPRTVVAEIALGMFEGAQKYGRHNYRVIGVRASTYFDAANRHLDAWWEGEDIDPQSGLSHITKAISSLVVLRDAMRRKMFEDDRPPAEEAGWQEPLNAKVGELIDSCDAPVPVYTEKSKTAVGP